MNKIISDNTEFYLASERLERFEDTLDKYKRGVIDSDELENRLSDSLSHLESEEKEWFLRMFMDVYAKDN